jgi:hypothetical protein
MSEYAPDKKPENMSDRMSKKWPTFFEVCENTPKSSIYRCDFHGFSLITPPFWVANLWKPPVI